LVKRNAFLSILVIGSVFALLSYLTSQSREISLTILYITLFIVSVIKIFEEWRYYHSYNAPLAASIFLLIPTLTGIGGSILAGTATIGLDGLLQTSFLNMTLSLDLIGYGAIYIFLNLFSLVFCLSSYLLILFLIQKYYSGRYPSIFIFRKRLPSELVILYNGVLILGFIVYWVENQAIEFITLIFLLMSIALFIQHYVFKVVVVPFRRIRSAPLPSRTLSSHNSTSRSTPTISWGDTRPPSSLRSQSSSPSVWSLSSVRVVPAISTPRTRTVNKLSPAIINSLTPLGQHLTEDDFRCIFCYEFPIEKDRQVVICPHCKHPSHENEYNKWIAVASICSRCNKPVKNVKMIRLPGSSYHKVINMFRKKN